MRVNDQTGKCLVSASLHSHVEGNSLSIKADRWLNDISFNIRHVADVKDVQKDRRQQRSGGRITNAVRLRKRTPAGHPHRGWRRTEAEPRILADTDQGVVEGCVDQTRSVQWGPQGDLVMEDLLCKGKGQSELIFKIWVPHAERDSLKVYNRKWQQMAIIFAECACDKWKNRNRSAVSMEWICGEECSRKLILFRCRHHSIPL